MSERVTFITSNASKAEQLSWNLGTVLDLRLGMAVSASLVLDIGGKARRYMSNKIKYTDEPADLEKALGSATAVRDFLPSPDKLVRRTEKEKITIAVDLSK